jgi:hypothetical protein
MNLTQPLGYDQEIEKKHIGELDRNLVHKKEKIICLFTT